MTNETISLLSKVVSKPETFVSVNHFVFGETYSFPAMVEVHAGNNFAYISDIRSLYDTDNMNSIDDTDKYHYVRFYIECRHLLSFVIPTTEYSITMDGTEEQLGSYMIPIGQKPKLKGHKLITSLVNNCVNKVIYQAKNAKQYALIHALMSANQDLQYN